MTKTGPRARKGSVTMAQQILAYHRTHAGVGPAEIAEQLGCHPTYCRQVLFKDKTREQPPAVHENGQGDLAKTIKQVKVLKQIGLERVRELLALLEAIHGK